MCALFVNLCKLVKPQSAYRYVAWSLSATSIFMIASSSNRREETRRTVQEAERRRATELERRAKEEKVIPTFLRSVS